MKMMRTIAVGFAGILVACQPSHDSNKADLQPAESAAPTSAPSTAREVDTPRPASSASPASPDMQARDETAVDARIDQVRLSNQGDAEKNLVGASLAMFSPQDTVYAEVLTSGNANTYTLYAKWIASDGSLLADYGIQVTQPGKQRTVVSLSKPDGWPLGENRLELAINGQAAKVATFAVR